MDTPVSNGSRRARRIDVRVLYLADIRFPLERANGIQTLRTCHALALRGHDVVLGVRPDTRRPARDPFAFYGVGPAPSLSVERALVAGPEPVRRAMYMAAALVRTTAASFDVVLTRDLGVASALLALPRRLRPPVVYESHGFAPTIATERPALLSDGRHASRRKTARLLARERVVWSHADGYVTITRTLVEEMRERFGDRRLVEVVRDGADLGPDERYRPWPAHSPVVVAYAGHLYPWKGVDVLLQAVSRVPSVRALVIGGHPGEADLPRLQRVARHLSLSQTMFTGLVDPARVAALLRGADILVLPNVETRISAGYTSPLKLFEYMAAGRPIVASDLPALREVLQDGVNAILVPPGDPDAMAAAINRLIGRPAEAERLAKRARVDAADYTWTRRAERLEWLLERVIAATRDGGAASRKPSAA